MRVVQNYSSRLEAEIGRTILGAEGIPSVIVGVDVAMEGGAAGIRLLVADDLFDAALEALLNVGS